MSDKPKSQINGGFYVPTIEEDGFIHGFFPITQRGIKRKRNQTWVYFLLGESEEILYVGATGDLRTRVMAHWRVYKDLVVSYAAIPFENRKQAFLKEAELINKFKPSMNRKFDFDSLNASLPL